MVVLREYLRSIVSLVTDLDNQYIFIEFLEYLNTCFITLGTPVKTAFKDPLRTSFSVGATSRLMVLPRLSAYGSTWSLTVSATLWYRDWARSETGGRDDLEIEIKSW